MPKWGLPQSSLFISIINVLFIKPINFQGYFIKRGAANNSYLLTSLQLFISRIEQITVFTETEKNQHST